MSRTLTASDRNRLIKLASNMAVGAPERKAILAGLSKNARQRPPEEDLYALKEIENAGRLSNVDPVLAKYLVRTGLVDGDTTDDKVPVKPSVFGAASLKPSQTTIKAWAVVSMALMAIRNGEIGGDLGAIISSDNYIMDGHHRWAATILAGGPNTKLGGFQAALPGKELIKVLNIATKGLFNVPAGNKGTGNITNLNPERTRALLEQYLVEGIKGEYPVSAEQVRKDLITGFGSVERGIEVMSDRAKMIRKTVPSWAPARSDMPVIEPEEAPEVASRLNRGVINWRLPILTEKERVAMVRLASNMAVGSPERKLILAGLSKSAATGKWRWRTPVDALRRKVKDLFYDHEIRRVDGDLGSEDGYDEYEGYSGRAMYGALSPLAFEVFEWHNGPGSDIGKALKRLGFMADRLGMGWIYYLPASGRMAGFQSKGLKKTKVASDSLFIPFLMPVRGGSKEVMPANGTDFTLREAQKMVGGYVEVVYLRDGRILLADEEGLLKGLPLNRAASRMAGRPIVGPALVMPNDMFR